MDAAVLAFALFATPPSHGLAPPGLTPRHRPGLRARPAPPLPWERLIRRCGLPCLAWARQILDAATSPQGFAWQLRLLARAGREAAQAGHLGPRQARRLRLALVRLGRALRWMSADGLLSHRERLQLLRGIIRTAAGLRQAWRRGARLRTEPWRHGPTAWRARPTPQPQRVPAQPPVEIDITGPRVPPPAPTK